MPAPLTAGEILDEALEDGREELARGSAGLALSGLGAGLTVSFSAVALGVVGALSGGVGLLAFAAYPIGFIFVMLSRQQLFTTNTVTPVFVVMDEDRSQLSNMLRMWGILFVSNVLGALVVAFVVWLVASAQDTTSQLLLIWAPVFLIPATGLVHCIAGSSEVMVSVFGGETPWGEFLVGFLLPATLGNTVGGLVLVTLLNYGQTRGSEPD